jgi:hypothetical protein
MRSALTVTVTAALAILAVLSIFFFSELQDKRVRQQESRRLAARLQTLEEQLAHLSQATNALAGQLAEVRQAVLSNASLAAANARAAEPAANSSTNIPSFSPYQVQVYVGQKALGQAWAIPTNVRRDPKSGRVFFDQVVSLPEAARAGLTTYVTNYVEHQVAVAAPQANQEGASWNYRYPWWWSAPVWGTPGRPSAPSERPAAPGYSPPAPRPSSGGPWTPVNIPPRPAPSRGLLVPPRPGDPGILAPVALR